MAMGDRILVIDKGRVRQVGTPAEVYDDPADTFVATFLGSPSMNLLEDGPSVLGFRPEHFRPAGEGRAESKRLSLPFRLTHEEYLGAERILYGRVSGGAFDGRSVVARLPSTHAVRFAPDLTHAFEAAEKDLRFFDRQTGARAAGPARS